MKYDQYVSLIKGLEAYAQTNRKAYEYKVLGLALLGYGYFFGLILFFLAVLAVIGLILIQAPGQILRIALLLGKIVWVAIPIIAAFFGFLGGAIKAMFAKVPEPTGRVVTRAEAATLFAFVEVTCKELRAQLPEKVIVTDEFNAAVATLPRFGMFGRRVYLLLGLPLMQALSPEQFKAVLAHEIGHISEKHGVFMKWAYQLREAWGRFIDSQEAHEHKFAALYEKFVNWFFPYFTAYSFVLMREHEREADQYSVQIAGAKPAGEALIALETHTARLNEIFWASVHEENTVQPEAPKGIFSRMLSELKSSDREQDMKSLARAVQVATDYNDSHPSLAERLRLIGYWNGEGEPELPPARKADAASYFFRDSVNSFVADFDTDWDQKIAKDWYSRYEHFQVGQDRMRELDAKGSDDDLSVDELIEKAGLIAEKQGNAAALPLLQQIVARYPEHPEANYLLGGVMLWNDDEAGLPLIHKAMDLDDRWRFPASDIAFQYLRSKGRLDEARIYANHMEQAQESLKLAQAERQTVSPGDSFELHSLKDADVEKAVSKLKYYDEIDAMYLVRKVVQHRPDLPFHVLFLDLHKAKFFGKPQLKPEELLKAVVDRLNDVEIGFIAVLEKEMAPIKPALEKIEGAKIFVR